MMNSIAGKIFFAMLSLLLITICATGIVTYNQLKENDKAKNFSYLQEKDKNVSDAIDYILSSSYNKITPENLPKVLSEKIYELADINKVDLNIFDLKGNLLLSSRPKEKVPFQSVIKTLALTILNIKNDRLVFRHKKQQEQENISTLSYLFNTELEPVGILHIPYNLNQNSWQKQFYRLLKRYGTLFFIILTSGGFLAWIFSKNITFEIEQVSEKLKDTQLLKHNTPIQYKQSDEIKPLIDAYNSMVNKFNNQSALLAKVEREDAWKLMARQVAHEIKNPLTPMQLSIQNFQRKFDPTDPKIVEKTNDLCSSLLTQVDTISSIANNFSLYARISPNTKGSCSVYQSTKDALEIFDNELVEIEIDNKEAIVNIEKEYYVRILTNLVKNAFESIPYPHTPKIKVHIKTLEKNIRLDVIDNGIGVNPEVASHIFEPNFTTKNSGTGLGLAMVKKLIEEHHGRIYFHNNQDFGSTFTVELPLEVKT
ncbi:MAG: hypothetical protein C4K58_07880 [Flavobacteriaceae bacterium]|nr:MAG: hypothetical protein C4K58_07880 [Flavobacteriaceae bacterium]